MIWRKDEMNVERMAAQFRRPKGRLGRSVARIMEENNIAAYRWVFERFRLRPGDKVLEIGFGHGWGLHELACRHPDLRLFGTDFSRLMLSQARRRNRDFIRQGRIVLRCGDILDYEAPVDLDAIFHINVLYFWNDLNVYFRKLLALLKPGGSLYSYMASVERLGTVPHAKSLIFNKYRLDYVRGELTRAGFHETSLNTFETDRGPAYLIRSRKPLTGC